MINKNLKIPFERALKLEPTDHKSRLINPVTGDIYQWDNFQKKWKSVFNAG